MASMSHPVKDLTTWLQNEAIEKEDMLDFLRDYVRRLHTYGIPIDRVFLGSKVLHPQAAAWSWFYNKLEGGDDKDEFTEFSMDKKRFFHMFESFPDEPLVKMEREGSSFIRHVQSDSYLPPGTVTDLFTKDGVTDLYGLPAFYKNEFRFGITWGTKNPDGFSEDSIDFFNETMPAFKVSVHLLLHRLVSYTLLCTYLGSDPGFRVHHGSVDRGDGVTVRSVIWFSDVRGFTSLSSRLDRDSVIALINDVFEETNSCLARHGGEILKFMGDGVLAIFKEPSGERRSSELRTSGDTDTIMDGEEATPEQTMCSRAKKAAAELQESLAKLSKKRHDTGLPGVSVGIGLHYGDCSYGNVGASSRLDFTVIGPHVNLASRVESLCSKLGACVLATEEFIKIDNCVEDWKCRGDYSVKGVPEPVSVFELASNATECQKFR